jgi:hypothetical protein
MGYHYLILNPWVFAMGLHYLILNLINLIWTLSQNTLLNQLVETNQKSVVSAERKRLPILGDNKLHGTLNLSCKGNHIVRIG